MSAILHSQPSIRPPFYPARPVNGGPLDQALPKSNGPNSSPWYWEPKYNDWRATLHVPTGRMWERHNKPLTIAGMFAEAIAELQSISDSVCRLEWLDVLALGRRHPFWRGTLVVLDLPDEATRPYDVRRQLLSDLFDEPESLFPDLCKQLHIIIPPLVTDPYRAWLDLQQINRELGYEFYEGLVAKRADSVYPLQLRSPDREFPFWMKHRWAF